MIVSVRYEEWQRREVFNDLLVGFWLGETLQQLLEDKAGAEHRACPECAAQLADFGERWRTVAAKRERPDTGIYENAQFRERSAL